MRPARALVAPLFALALAIAPSQPALGDPASGPVPAPAWRIYRPPTAGVVLDPFRPPPEPWMAGNRGIEYGTEPGSELVAIGPGRIAFAGPVAGRLVVSIVHPDGLRSSLTGVAAITARVGDVVWAGAPVALAADRTHLGVRRGDDYLDPASLWGTVAGGGVVHLVPTGPSTERAPPPPTASFASLASGRRLLRW